MLAGVTLRTWLEISEVILLRFNLETKFYDASFEFSDAFRVWNEFWYLWNVFKVDQKLLVFEFLVLCPFALVDEQQRKRWNIAAYESTTLLGDASNFIQFWVFCRFRCKLIYVESSEWVWMKLSWISIDFPLIKIYALELKIFTMASRNRCLCLSMDDKRTTSDQIIGRCCWLQLKSMILRLRRNRRGQKYQFRWCRSYWDISLVNQKHSKITKPEKLIQVQSFFTTNLKYFSTITFKLRSRQPLALSMDKLKPQVN